MIDIISSQEDMLLEHAIPENEEERLQLQLLKEKKELLTKAAVATTWLLEIQDDLDRIGLYKSRVKILGKPFLSEIIRRLNSMFRENDRNPSEAGDYISSKIKQIEKEF